MHRRSFLTLFGADPALDHLHPYETSWLLPPILLGAMRAVISIYIFFCIIFIFSYYATHAGEEHLIGETFSYFTDLNLWGMGFYFAAAAIHSLAYAATGKSVIFEKLPRFFRGLHALFYSCVTTFPILVMIIYWAVLYSGTWFPTWFGAWSNVSKHKQLSLFPLFPLFRSKNLLTSSNQTYNMNIDLATRSYWPLHPSRNIPYHHPATPTHQSPLPHPYFGPLFGPSLCDAQNGGILHLFLPRPWPPRRAQWESCRILLYHPGRYHCDFPYHLGLHVAAPQTDRWENQEG